MWWFLVVGRVLALSAVSLFTHVAADVTAASAAGIGAWLTPLLLLALATSTRLPRSVRRQDERQGAHPERRGDHEPPAHADLGQAEDRRQDHAGGDPA